MNIWQNDCWQLSATWLNGMKLAAVFEIKEFVIVCWKIQNKILNSIKQTTISFVGLINWARLYSISSFQSSPLPYPHILPSLHLNREKKSLVCNKIWSKQTLLLKFLQVFVVVISLHIYLVFQNFVWLFLHIL